MPTSYPPFHPASSEKFRSNYRNFSPLLERADLLLWDDLNNDAMFSHMRSATECWGYPAVAGVTSLLSERLEKVPVEEIDYVKKGIGAMVCCIMEANGYSKTGVKRAVPPIPRRVFTKGEVYQRPI